MDKNQEESVLSKIFTEKELEELSFTDEEIEAIESAETLSKIADVLPEDEMGITKIFEKIDKEFPDEMTPAEMVAKYEELAHKDLKFIDQLFAISYVISYVTPVPEPKTEKVSLDAIESIQKTIAESEKNEKYKAILEAIKNMKPEQE